MADMYYLVESWEEQKDLENEIQKKTKMTKEDIVQKIKDNGIRFIAKRLIEKAKKDVEEESVSLAEKLFGNMVFITREELFSIFDKQILSKEEIYAEIKKIEDLENEMSLRISKVIDDIQFKLADGDESKIPHYSDESWGQILLEKQTDMGNNFEDIINILKSNA